MRRRWPPRGRDSIRKDRNVPMHGQKLLIAGFVFMMLLSLPGCRNTDEETSDPGNPGDISQTAETVDESDAAAYEEYHYSFEPHVIAEEYINIYGKGIEEEFYRFCDAILSGDSTFSCRSKERFYQLMSIADTCFPLAGGLIDRNGTYVENGFCHISYLFDEKETEGIINTFTAKVSSIIRSAVPYDEPDHIKAMELYTAVARKDTYDQSYTLEDSLNLKTYRAIMADIGICQEIAGEYIYYLLQVGIDAITVSALNRDQSEAHEWVLARIDGTYYHIDPTYATSYPESLYFFGLDDIQREYYGDLPVENYSYAESDLPDRDRYLVKDRRFEKYWLAESYVIDHAERKISIRNNNGDEHEYGFDE